MLTRKVFCVTAALLTCLTAAARERASFDKDWRFMLADTAAMARPDYNDAHWRRLDVPHDWAIEGDFYAGNPSGAGGGALPGGVGWYRKVFSLSRSDNAREKVFLEFDGVYMNATVYVNGQKVYNRPYGYSSFEIDITPYVSDGENVVAVRVDNSDQPNSRWYSGCGIYRHVWLTKTAAVHVAHWGVSASSTVVKGKGRLGIEVTLVGQGTVENTLIDPRGRVVGRSKGLKSVITVAKPMLWSCETPHIYKVRTQVKVGGRVVDEVVTTTGFRDFRFDASTGFWLNGKRRKLNGVCEHHDLGCLGAALHEDALHRKLVKLKAMGVNAIRSSHNPPAPELLNMCDTMGLIVMDESFDMWRRRKTQNDYARFFDEWHERDLADLVMRDRNHPSVLMWSIGNEVLEQWEGESDMPRPTPQPLPEREGSEMLGADEANLLMNMPHEVVTEQTTPLSDREGQGGGSLTRLLADIVHRYDTTRPITAGCNEPSPGNHLYRSGALDIIGYNYHHREALDVPRLFPGQPFIFTESVSALQTRGNYMMPSDSVRKAPKEWWLPYTDPTFMCSAYDNMHASWSSTHEETWDVVKHNDYVGGQFIWTGFDYIGEPTPYGFPARSSYFGLIDLAGFPKDTYYMYQSEWTTKPMLHIFPHWNWLPGQEIDLWAYYNQADEVELYINGRSQGVRSKDAHTYHVMWRVRFEPGEVRAVSRKDGKVVCEQTIRTAGQPDHIRLTTDYQGDELTFVKAEVVDKDGNLCPWAEDQLLFTIDGGRVVATDNGCQTSMERFTSPRRKAFFGRCLAVVRGKGVLKAQAIGLKDGILGIEN